MTTLQKTVLWSAMTLMWVIQLSVAVVFHHPGYFLIGGVGAVYSWIMVGFAAGVFK